MATVIYGFPVVSGGCASIYFHDITSLFPQYPTGYGASFSTGDVQNATLTINSPSNVVTVIDVHSVLPSSDVNVYYEVTSASLGLSSITDGLWQFNYTLAYQNPGLGIATWEGNCLFTCNVECKMKTLAAKIATCKSCDCKDKNLALLQQAIALHWAIKQAMCCGYQDRAIALLGNLEDLLVNVNCTCD